jgi:FixJ family two-component response regulator
VSGPAPHVLVVDDDASVRKSLERLLRAAGYEVSTFPSARELLALGPDEGDAPCCAVLDVDLPGTSGIELQGELARRSAPIPIVFITGHGDIPMGVQAMKDGAVDFLPKPFDESDLLDAVDRAITRDVEIRERRREVRVARDLLARLTPREHEVLRGVIAGLLNKQIARRLGIAEKTVKVHRGRVMQKAEVSSVAELVRVAQKAGVRPADRVT